MSPYDDLPSLVKQLCALETETEYVEFKESNSDPEQIGKDICALANSAVLCETRFAYKLWGVEDKEHRIVGTSFNPKKAKKGNQELELWLRRKLSSNVQFSFEDVEIDARKVVVLRIWPALYQIALFDGAPYIRTGSCTQKLERGSQREVELWRKIQHEVFEVKIAASGMQAEDTLSRLDYETYFDRQGIPVPADGEAILHYFERERLVVRQDDGFYSITNMGALLFAKDLSSFPEVSRKAARVIQYEGASRLVMQRERTFDAGYVVCLDEVIDYVMTLLPSREVIEKATRRTVSQLPELAVREVVANALIHQDFSVRGAGPLVEIFDARLEVSNPGRPLVDVWRILNDPPCSRNEKMAALLRRLDLCEEAGTGWDKTVAICEYRTLPAPLIETRANSTIVTLFAAVPFKKLTASERRQACYWHACIRYANKESMTNQSLRERFGLGDASSSIVSRLIKECVEANLVKPLDADSSRKFMKYIPAWA